jgi:hypothetical protein
MAEGREASKKARHPDESRVSSDEVLKFAAVDMKTILPTLLYDREE